MSIGILHQALIANAKKKLAAVQAAPQPILQKPNNIGVNLGTNYSNTGIPKQVTTGKQLPFAQHPIGKALPGVVAIKDSIQQKSFTPINQHLGTKIPDATKLVTENNGKYTLNKEEMAKTSNLAMGFTGGGTGGAGKKISKHIVDKLKSESTDVLPSSAQQISTKGNNTKITNLSGQKSQDAYQANIQKNATIPASPSGEILPLENLRNGALVPESSLQQTKSATRSLANSTKPMSLSDNLALTDSEIKSLEKSAMSHLSNKPELELARTKQAVDEAKLALEFKKEGLKETMASQLTKFRAKGGEFKGGLPEVGGSGKPVYYKVKKVDPKTGKSYYTGEIRETKSSVFAREGDDIADEIGYADSEAARKAYGEYAAQRSILKQDEAVLKSARREFLDSKKQLADTRQLQKKIVPESSFTTTEPIGDPVQKITALLKKAESLQGSQDALYRAERAHRIARVAKMGERVPGEQGYFAQLGQLKGGLPRVDFKSIRNQVSQKDVDTLFDAVEQSRIFSPFEKVTAKGALAKILGKDGGILPTRNEIELLSEVFPPDFINAILKNRSTWQKIMAGAGQAINLPRAVMATADLSAPMRQGIFLIGKPKQFIPAFKEMFRYAFSQKAYEGLMDSIQARPTYKIMRQNQLALTDMGKFMARREEDFMSSLVEKVPLFGRLAKGSNRAYSGFLNKLRADVFDDLYKKAQKLGIDKARPKAIEDIAKFINSATGRGDLGRLQKMAPVLNGLFFSPRLMASRFNLLNPIYYAKLDPFARKEALKSLVTFGSIAMTVLGLAKLGGADLEADPRNANFGKIKIDNTRYDILGGFQQYIRLAAQLVSGKIISSTTGREITLGEGYKPLTRKDVLFRFFENKESPVASFVTALMTGKTGMGEDFNLPIEVINRFIPLVTQDMFDIYKERGLEDMGMALPGLFGVGSQTYGGQDLIQGKNALGKDTNEIKPKLGIGETIASKIFGAPILTSSKSYDVESYYDQMRAMPKEQAKVKFEEIARTNPALAKKISQVAEDRKLGITVQDKALKAKGVTNGERAMAIAEEFAKLKSKEEKKALWEEYVKKSVITKEVATQLVELLKK